MASQNDQALRALLGMRIVASSGDSYDIHTLLGEGGMSVAFGATRWGALGTTPVVVKALRPSFIQEAGPRARLSFHKEATALQRLNDRAPPTPFVVRLLDIGGVSVTTLKGACDVPWIAVEFVDGGDEGTTLRQRVEGTLQATKFGFDVRRARRLVECLASGLGAIHGAGIVHRDLKPDNVLCCGRGVDELWKIADFGIAGGPAFEATFGAGVGSIGYAPPEQIGNDTGAIGPWSDVFALAAVTFYALTGDPYLSLGSVDGPPSSRGANLKRKRLIDAPTVDPTLRDRPAACAALDELLERSTASRPEQRPTSAALFAASALGCLEMDGNTKFHQEAFALRKKRLTSERGRSAYGQWRWSVACRPAHDRIVRSVAWNSDGRCLTATATGLSFWTGSEWQDLTPSLGPSPPELRFVRRLAPGEWLIGGDDGALFVLGPRGVAPLARGPQHLRSVQLASGDLHDIALFVLGGPAAPPQLQCSVHGRWLRAMPLDDVAYVSAIARYSDEKWLVVGRDRVGGGYAALCAPLDWNVERLAYQGAALLSCAAQPELGMALATGVDGSVLWVDGGEIRASGNTRYPSAACAIDSTDRAWVGTPGALWTAVPREHHAWVCAWEDAAWSSPFVSLYADDAVVYAMTADGGIIEGRRGR